MYKPIKLQTKEKDFQYFVERCNFWLDKIHLNNWYVSYEHVDLGDTCYAQSQGWIARWKAVIRLNKNWSNNGDQKSVDKESLDIIARHEVLHILMLHPEEEVVARLTKIIQHV